MPDASKSSALLILGPSYSGKSSFISYKLQLNTLNYEVDKVDTTQQIGIHRFVDYIGGVRLEVLMPDFPGNWLEHHFDVYEVQKVDIKRVKKNAKGIFKVISFCKNSVKKEEVSWCIAAILCYMFKLYDRSVVLFLYSPDLADQNKARITSMFSGLLELIRRIAGACVGGRTQIYIDVALILNKLDEIIKPIGGDMDEHARILAEFEKLLLLLPFDTTGVITNALLNLLKEYSDAQRELRTFSRVFQDALRRIAWMIKNIRIDRKELVYYEGGIENASNVVFRVVAGYSYMIGKEIKIVVEERGQKREVVRINIRKRDIFTNYLIESLKDSNSIILPIAPVVSLPFTTLLHSL